MRVSQLEEHPVYAKFFEQASKGPLSKATPMVPPGGAGIGMHVIPVEKAIDAASTRCLLSISSIGSTNTMANMPLAPAAAARAVA